MKTARPYPRQARYPADPMALFKTMAKHEPFTKPELLRLELPIRLSFEALKTGKGQEHDFHDLAAAINTALVRAEQIDELCAHTAIAARDALMRCWHRFERTGVWGFDGPALYEVEAGIDLHEQLLRLSTPQQMVRSLKTVIERGRSGEVAA